MNVIKVRDAADQLGISTQTIRRLEREHIIPPVPRAYNGHRVFTQEYIDRIRAVLFPTGQGEAQS